MTIVIKKKSLVEPILLGKVGASYGVRGWIRAFSFTKEAEDIFNYKPWFIRKIGQQWKEVDLEGWRYHHQRIIIKLKGINDRNAASLLTNSEIVVDTSQLPVLSDGDFYWKDLIGCQVITTKGLYLGKVVNIVETGSRDVLIIEEDLKNVPGIKKKERLIPFLEEEFIKKVNLNTRTIEVDWDLNS